MIGIHITNFIQFCSFILVLSQFLYFFGIIIDSFKHLKFRTHDKKGIVKDKKSILQYSIDRIGAHKTSLFSRSTRSNEEKSFVRLALGINPIIRFVCKKLAMNKHSSLLFCTIKINKKVLCTSTLKTVWLEQTLQLILPQHEWQRKSF